MVTAYVRLFANQTAISQVCTNWIVRVPSGLSQASLSVNVLFENCTGHKSQLVPKHNLTSKLNVYCIVDTSASAFENMEESATALRLVGRGPAAAAAAKGRTTP